MISDHGFRIAIATVIATPNAISAISVDSTSPSRRTRGRAEAVPLGFVALFDRDHLSLPRTTIIRGLRRAARLGGGRSPSHR